VVVADSPDHVAVTVTEPELATTYRELDVLPWTPMTAVFDDVKVVWLDTAYCVPESVN
jgi:hypothetical protein